jgi:hypothetical protein
LTASQISPPVRERTLADMPDCVYDAVKLEGDHQQLPFMKSSKAQDIFSSFPADIAPSLETARQSRDGLTHFDAGS